MHGLYNVKDLLMEELESHADDETLTEQSLKEIDTLAHALKNITKVIECCDDDEHSGRYYARDYSGRGRDRMGRYTRAPEPETHPEPDIRASYGSKEQIINQLENMMRTAADEHTRGKFRELIRTMRNG